MIVIIDVSVSLSLKKKIMFQLLPFKCSQHSRKTRPMDPVCLGLLVPVWWCPWSWVLGHLQTQRGCGGQRVWWRVELGTSTCQQVGRAVRETSEGEGSVALGPHQWGGRGGGHPLSLARFLTLGTLTCWAGLCLFRWTFLCIDFPVVRHLWPLCTRCPSHSCYPLLRDVVKCPWLK